VCSSECAKNRDETTILGRLRRQIIVSGVTGQENGLRWLGTAVGLNPVAVGAINRPGPDTERFGSKSRARQLEDDAAHVLTNKVICAVEVEVVDGANWIKKEPIAPPASKETMIFGFRHERLFIHRDRPLFNEPALVAGLGGLAALDPAQHRGLFPVCKCRQTYAVHDVRDRIRVRVDLEFIDRVGGERLGPDWLPAEAG
jgi:hypothetical protein